MNGMISTALTPGKTIVLPARTTPSLYPPTSINDALPRISPMTAITSSTEALATLSSTFLKTQDACSFDRFLDKMDQSDVSLSYQTGGPLSGSFDMSQSMSTLRDFRAINTEGTEYSGGPLSSSLPPSAITSALRDFMDHANTGVSSRSSVGTATCVSYVDRTSLLPSSPSSTVDLTGTKSAKLSRLGVKETEPPFS